MTLPMLVAGLLALAVMLAWIRLPLAHRRDPRAPRHWRLLVLLALQPLLAFTLYRALFPPVQPLAADVLTVLTAGASERDLPAPGERGRLLALPEAGAFAGAERVPDLATALRRWPASRLQVVGHGLEPRDRGAVQGYPLDFNAPELSPGIVRVAVAGRPAVGDVVRIGGQVTAVDGGRVELLDPAGRRVDAVALEASGRFLLEAPAFAAGAAEFTLRVVDGDGRRVDEAGVPVWIAPAVPPRVLLLAGAPNPETRALRRWLEDAGAQVQARVSLGAGVQLGAVALDEASLAAADLLLVDARAWTDLGEGGRMRVLSAVRQGLGLMVRADTPLPASALRPLRGSGFLIEGGTGVGTWQLPGPRLSDEDALRARRGAVRDAAQSTPEVADAAMRTLGRRDWRVSGDDAAVLGEGSGQPAGWWRAEGQGRLGLWTVVDSFRLPLAGHADLFDALWSGAVARLARARAQALPGVPEDARVGQRLVLCGLPDNALVQAPDARELQVLVDPCSGVQRCGAVWPEQAGWHHLRIGEDERAFHVLAADAAPLRRQAELREATLQLAGAAQDARHRAQAGTGARGPAWPWWLGWLLLAGLCWWFERARLGLAARSAN